KARARVVRLGPCSTWINCSASTSQIRIDSSAPAAARRRPSALNATQCRLGPGLRSMTFSRPVLGSQSRSEPSGPAETSTGGVGGRKGGGGEIRILVPGPLRAVHRPHNRPGGGAQDVKGPARAGGRKPLLIRAEGHSKHRAAVTDQRQALRGFDGIPEFECPV